MSKERTNMYIKNIKPTISEEQFKQAMQTQGDVVSVMLKPFKGYQGKGDVVS